PACTAICAFEYAIDGGQSIKDRRRLWINDYCVYGRGVQPHAQGDPAGSAIYALEYRAAGVRGLNRGYSWKIRRASVARQISIPCKVYGYAGRFINIAASMICRVEEACARAVQLSQDHVDR